MKKINLGIFFGGDSSEYSVSLHSVASVIRSIHKDLYNITYIGISKQGNWYKFYGEDALIEHDEWLVEEFTDRATLSCNPGEGLLVFGKDGTIETVSLDCALPIMHGKFGEDGVIQGLFKLAGLPYVGCDHISSAIAMDKEFTHRVCESAGIHMANYLCLKTKDDVHSAFDLISKSFGFPVFIKPANAGSSFGISKAINLEQFKNGLDLAFRYDLKVIVESAIDGFEVGCSILGNTNLMVGEIDEIDTTNEYFDFDAKYQLENTTIHCPARISEDMKSKIKDTATRIFQLLGCSGLSRVDFFIDTNDVIYFNEINTIPGFTSLSRYPTMMSKVGVSFEQLLDKLIQLALGK